MSDTKLNGRLCSAASFVRQRAVLADIGTDHAYLPIFLASEGVIDRAYATDINKGPLEKAKENISRAELGDKIECILTDGAEKLSDLGITDYTVCGMGGELIADIISRAPQLSSPEVRLILQPMSKQAHLRAYLLGAGFSIIAEAYSSDSGKDYVTLVAEYSGVCRFVSEAECELPLSGTPLHGKDSMLRYYKTKSTSLHRALAGRQRGGDSSPEAASVAERIDAFITQIENYT